MPLRRVTSVVLKQEVLDWLKATSAADNRSVSNLVESLCLREMKKQEVVNEVRSEIQRGSGVAAE